jgi:isovaleryl-CoA dehydrogenase
MHVVARTVAPDLHTQRVVVEIDEFRSMFPRGETLAMHRGIGEAPARDRIAPLAADIDASNRFPRHLWPELGELGLLGITADEVYGGTGLGYLAHVIAMEEISRASASVGLSYGAHSNLCVNQLQRWGNDGQRRRYLPKLVSGEHVGALAMSETGAGSDVMGMSTRARRDGDQWLLNGSKMWITNGPEANVVIVYAVSGADGDKRSLSAFIVERDFPGFSTAQKLDKLGMRGSDTSEIVLENCVVPHDNLLGGAGRGAAVLMSGLDYERVVLAAGSLGIMRSCFDLVLPYVHDRKQFGQPIGSFQLMQAKLADMYTTMNACRAYVYAVARACDRDRGTRFDAAGCILMASEKATWMAGETVQALGGNGYINEYPAGRLWRDAKLYEIGAGTSEIRRMLIGRELFNVSAA